MLVHTQLKGIGEWLGLRPGLDEADHYNFKEAVAVGKYNTGDRTGYTTTTPWSKEDLVREREHEHDPGDEVDPSERAAPAGGGGKGGHPVGQNAELIALAKVCPVLRSISGRFCAV
jgi:hypothetical protein